MLFPVTPRPAADNVLNDAWVAVSALQKSIRRGDVTNALLATSFLIERQADRFWRRLCIIAIEDIGIGDLDIVRDVMLASGRKAWRQEIGEWEIAANLVQRLCAARKCRDTEHLLIVADHDPCYAGQRSAFLDLSTGQLCEILADTSRPLPARTLAAWLIAGTKRFPSPVIPERVGSFGDLLACYRHLGVPEDVLEVARLGSVRMREAHPVVLPLVWLAATASSEITVQEMDFEEPAPIRGWPAYAFDIHTRAGKKANDYFARRCVPLRVLADRYLLPDQIGEFFGTLIFRAEGSLVDRRLVYPGSRALLRAATLAHLHYPSLPETLVLDCLEAIGGHSSLLHQCRLDAVKGLPR
jgi:hypothetical protein